MLRMEAAVSTSASAVAAMTKHPYKDHLSSAVVLLAGWMSRCASLGKFRMVVNTRGIAATVPAWQSRSEYLILAY